MHGDCIDAGGEGGGPSAYWRRRFHFQLENEFPVTNSRGGPREWSGVEWLCCGCAVSVCCLSVAWRRRGGGEVLMFMVFNVYSVYNVSV